MTMSSATLTYCYLLLPYAPGYTLLTMTTWLCHVLRLCVMVRTVSVCWHLRSGTRCHLLSRTFISVMNSSSRVLRLGSLSKSTHRRRHWELLLKWHFTNDRFHWLIMSPLRRHIFVCFMAKSAFGVFFGPSSVKRGWTHIVLWWNM